MNSVLTYQEQDNVIQFINRANYVIKNSKANNIYKLIKGEGDFIKNFKLLNKSDGDSALDKVYVEPTLSSLGEIFGAFAMDIAIAVKEDLLQIRPYKGVTQKDYEDVIHLENGFQFHYLPVLLLDVISNIKYELENINEPNSYGIILSEVEKHIFQKYQSIHSNTKIFEMVNSLQLELTKIDMKILTDDLSESNTKTIKELVKSFAGKYEDILSEAKRYDNLVSDLELINIY